MSNDLNIYKKNGLKSTCIEIVNPRKSNIIVGVIYRHPSDIHHLLEILYYSIAKCYITKEYRKKVSL